MHFIEDRPIQSRRIGELERFGRWCRRNPVPAGLLAALVMVFWTGFGLVAWKWRDAVAEREAKEAQVVKANAAGVEARAAADREVAAEKNAVAAADRAGLSLYFSLIDRARSSPRPPTSPRPRPSSIAASRPAAAGSGIS